MKKIIKFAITACLFLALIPTQVNAETASDPKPKSTITAAEAAQAEILLNRLNEIKDMDKSDMSSAEKKELRKEVRSIKQALAEVHGGVYLSVGAVIIIILLLILLL